MSTAHAKGKTQMTFGQFEFGFEIVKNANGHFRRTPEQETDE